MIIVILCLTLVVAIVPVHRLAQKAKATEKELHKANMEIYTYKEHSRMLEEDVRDMTTSIRYLKRQNAILNNEVAKCHGRSSMSYVTIK